MFLLAAHKLATYSKLRHVTNAGRARITPAGWPNPQRQGVLKTLTNAPKERKLYRRLKVPNLHQGERTVPKYVIEREIPGAGKLSPQQLQAVSQKSCGVLRACFKNTS
jgi:hypothetical protein